MVIRRAIQCGSCDSIFITRTQVGHKDQQKHSFPCPKCGVLITYTLDLDQERAKHKFRDPVNAKWSLTEVGALETLTFSDEILVPADMGGGFSPHLATWGNYEDFDKYRYDEGLRQLFKSKLFAYGDRCLAHFERGNWELFDKESPAPAGHEPSPSSRLITLYNFFHAGFSKFTINSKGKYDRILQRIEYAKASSPVLFAKLAETFLLSGRIRRLWQEIAANRRALVENYDGLQPLYQMYYWKKELRVLDSYHLSDKRFDPLRQLYIDCFETTCRLMVAAIGVEAIIFQNGLELPTNKGSMTLDDFEAQKNANKLDHIEKYPIGDLFVPAVDAGLRNGIGHHSAHYDRESDQIILYDTKKTGLVASGLGYTDFCDRVVKLFSVFELAVMYHNGLHIFLGGTFY
jgi:hypothetical protein